MPSKEPKRITLRPSGFEAFSRPMGWSKGRKPQEKMEKPPQRRRENAFKEGK